MSNYGRAVFLGSFLGCILTVIVLFGIVDIPQKMINNRIDSCIISIEKQGYCELKTSKGDKIIAKEWVSWAKENTLQK